MLKPLALLLLLPLAASAQPSAPLRPLSLAWPVASGEGVLRPLPALSLLDRGALFASVGGAGADESARFAVGILGGTLGYTVGVLALGSMGGYLGGCGPDASQNPTRSCSVGLLLGGLSGIILGTPLGVTVAGHLVGLEGNYLAALGGTLAGLLAVLGAEHPLGVLLMLVVGPILGAVAGFEGSMAFQPGLRMEAVFPVALGPPGPSSGLLGLRGTF